MNRLLILNAHKSALTELITANVDKLVRLDIDFTAIKELDGDNLSHLELLNASDMQNLRISGRGMVKLTELRIGGSNIALHNWESFKSL